MSSVGSNKGELRRRFRAQQNPFDIQQASERVCRSLRDWFAVSGALREAGAWAGYQALPDEPDLTEAYHDLAMCGICWAYPVVEGEKLRFFEIDDHRNSANWAMGPWGLREPDRGRCREIAVTDLAGMVVPGVAFDRHGARLGRGKGFYDRTLQNFNGTKVGIAFRERLTESSLPLDAHDIHMDWIVTEDEYLRAQHQSYSQTQRKLK
ncbi:MAG: 5-formyltetrahydrofolate cyclo-ligase [Bdellovibrionaceae bacterium]|nr:5-formyltetrahydrofolate cyclo-ligase [Pseudobdellovibrionaceae bacterium]